MRAFPFPLLATAIGSMPHTDPSEAVDAVLRTLPDLPAWPQLYQRSPLEHMVPQFAQGLPGARIERDRVVLAGLPAEHGPREIGSDRAAGLHAFLQGDLHGAQWVKGQATGPLTFAYLVTLEGGKSVLQDLRIVRRLAHHLGQVAAWQEWKLRRAAPQTLMFLDEPLLPRALAESRIGSALAADLLASTLVWLRGLKGLHCCAPPPWDFLFHLPLDVISFDAYHYAHTLEAASHNLEAYLAGGGAVAWGIVPTDAASLEREDAESLAGLVFRTWDRLAGYGIPRELLEQGALITPACGLATLTPQGAERALEMTGQVAMLLRRSVRLPDGIVVGGGRYLRQRRRGE